MNLVISKGQKYSLEPKSITSDNFYDYRANNCIFPHLKQNVKDLSLDVYVQTFDVYLKRMMNKITKNIQNIQHQGYEVKINQSNMYHDFCEFVYRHSNNRTKSYHFLK